MSSVELISADKVVYVKLYSTFKKWILTFEKWILQWQSVWQSNRIFWIIIIFLPGKWFNFLLHLLTVFRQFKFILHKRFYRLLVLVTLFRHCAIWRKAQVKPVAPEIVFSIPRNKLLKLNWEDFSRLERVKITTHWDFKMPISSEDWSSWYMHEYTKKLFYVDFFLHWVEEEIVDIKYWCLLTFNIYR